MPATEDLIGFASLAALDDTDRATLARAGREVFFPAGHRLIAEGQPADRCWLIKTGRIQLGTRVPGHDDIVLQTLHSGDLLGWSWLVPPYRWHFGAVATEDVVAVEFESEALAQLSEQDPRFGRALLLTLFEALLGRLQATRARLVDMYRAPAPAPADREVARGGYRSGS